MKRSQVIALAGISAALACVAIILSRFVDIMTLSMCALAGICIMLPLTVGSFAGGLFAYVSASILGFFVSQEASMSFIIFFGPYVLLLYLVDFKLYDKMKTPKWAKLLVGYIIKGVFYAGMVTGLYYLMTLVFNNPDYFIESKWLWAVILFLMAFFFAFDILMRLCFINLRRIVLRYANKLGPEEKKQKEVKKSEDVDVFGIDDKKDERVDANGEEKQNVKTEYDSSSVFEHILKNEEDSKDIGDDEEKDK